MAAFGIGRKLIGRALLLAFLTGMGGALLLRAQSLAILYPGTQPDNTILLSNGWRLAPVGKLVKVGDLPLNAVQSPDGRFLIVTNNGLDRPSFSVIDLSNGTIKATFPIVGGWNGLVWHPSLSQSKFYSAGAGLNNVQEFGFDSGTITPLRTFALPGPTTDTRNFASGVAISPDGLLLYATQLFALTLSTVDLSTGAVTKTITLPAEPYGLVVSADSKTLYVSLWGGSRVQVYNAKTLALIRELTTGERPNAMVLSPDGKRLFVACAGAASVWTFTTALGDPIEQISASLFPNAPPTASPNALSISPDGTTLVVANADNNAVVDVDISNPIHAFVSGFIPTGWYPTAAIFSRDGTQIFILSGKGMTPSTNPVSMIQRLQGTVAIVPTPDRTTLSTDTQKVYSLTPYTDSIRLTPANAPAGSPIPAVVGGASPIKHVFYVIRENRTYDQVLGDMPQGNGDPSLVLFGVGATPNAHSVSANFALFDNFYVDADVSYDGHAYSTAAYANDFVEKVWQTYYGNRGAMYLSEGGGFFRNPFGNIAAPQAGYIWDYANYAHVSVRDYGEFAANQVTGTTVTATPSVPGLTDEVAPTFAAFDLSIMDTVRTNAFQNEFSQYVQNGQLPQLSIIRLGNDHTYGATPGTPTPLAMIGENDYALGRIVEMISKSVYWSTSAIFVVEDDSQNGLDHVDSHRSVALVASPYTKHGYVDHTFYTTSGVLRTMELILGLPPMSQYDAAATPMYNAFQTAPNLATYTRIQPNVAFDARNPAVSADASASLRMDFSDADLAPEQELNAILWRSVRGNQPMPPPRRSVFALRH